MDTTVAVSAKTQSFLTKVYSWMGLALFVTGVVSLVTVSSPSLLHLIFTNRLVFYGLLIGELVLVIYLSVAINKISSSMATFFFLLYSVVNGLSLSVIFLAFTFQSIATAFFVTSLTFVAMAIYGYTTKRDLTTVGSIALMGLVGIILSGVVNLFLNNNTLDLVTSAIGILVFVGLIAYDSQRLKQMSASSDPESYSKAAIMGALILYLDFINLFLKILRFTGKRR